MLSFHSPKMKVRKYLNVFLIEVTMSEMFFTRIVTGIIRESTRVESFILAEMFKHLDTLAPRTTFDGKKKQ